MRPRAAWVGAIYLQLRAKLIRTHESISFVSHTQIGPTHLGGPGVQPFKTPFRHRFTPPSPRRSASAIREIAVDTLVDAIAQMVSDNPHRNKKDGSRDVSYTYFWRHRPGQKCAPGQAWEDGTRYGSQSLEKRCFPFSKTLFEKVRPKVYFTFSGVDFRKGEVGL